MLTRRELLTSVKRGFRRNKLWTVSISLSWLMAFSCLIFRSSLQGVMLGSQDIEIVRERPTTTRKHLTDLTTTADVAEVTEPSKRILDPNGLPFIDVEKLEFLAVPSKVCNRFREPELICIVFSHIYRYHYRETVRNGWVGVNAYPPNAFGVFFVIERTGDETDFELSSLENETATYEDILYVDYENRSTNYSYRSVGSHHFVMGNCATALHVVNIDDNTVVNLKQLVEKLKSMDTSTNSIACHYTSVREFENPKVKFSNASESSVMPVDKYKKLNITIFCPNSGYVVTLPLLDIIHQGYSRVQPILPDNIYVTGILTQNAEVSWTKLNVLEDGKTLQNYLTQKTAEETTFHLFTGLGKTTFANVSYALRQKNVF